MEKLSAGQVVLVSFPFSDLSSQKLRPCLVLGLAEFGDVILCQITSKSYGGKKAISLRQNDFAQGSLIIDSYIRPDKIATLDQNMIAKALGIINENKHNQVKSELKKLFEMD